MGRSGLGGFLATTAKRLFRKSSPLPTMGDVAPDFDLSDHKGERVKLSGLRGKRVVLWFYPKADTPG